MDKNNRQKGQVYKQTWQHRKKRYSGDKHTVSHKAHISLWVHLNVSGILAMELLGWTFISNHILPVAIKVIGNYFKFEVVEPVHWKPA